MKPRVSASPPPISVGDDDDDDDDDDANDAEEEGSVERTIGRSSGRHASVQYKKGQRSNGVGLGFVFGTGEDTDTSVDSAPRSPRPPRPRIHPRTASRSPSSAQSIASTNANRNAGANRMNMQRLLGHGRALSIDRAAAAAGVPPRTKPRSSTTTTTPTTPVSAGFRDPLVVRREESEARTKAAPAPPRVVAGKPRAPVGELVAYFDKS